MEFTTTGWFDGDRAALLVRVPAFAFARRSTGEVRLLADGDHITAPSGSPLID